MSDRYTGAVPEIPSTALTSDEVAEITARASTALRATRGAGAGARLIVASGEAELQERIREVLSAWNGSDVAVLGDSGDGYRVSRDEVGRDHLRPGQMVVALDGSAVALVRGLTVITASGVG